MAAQASARGNRTSRLTLTRPADVAVLLGIVVTAWLFDLGAHSANIGLAFSASLVAAAAALAVAGRPHNGWSRLLLVAAVAMAPCLTLRASPWLQWPDLVVTVGLLACAAVMASDGSPFGASFAQVRAWTARLLSNMAQVAAFVGAPLSAAGDRLTRDARPTIKQLGRGLAIAIPIACVIGFLLASADPIFASFFKLDLDPASLLEHLFWLALGGWVMGGLLRTSLNAAGEQPPRPLWRINPLEAVVVLLVVDAIFLAFGAAQLVTALGGGVEALHAANMTYAEYARSGFFQLLAAAAITLPLLRIVTTLSKAPTRRLRLAITVLVELAVLLTIAVVVVAHQRLSLYEAAYGFTMLRLYSHVFALWIALVFAFFGASILGAGFDARWFPGAAAAAGLALLFGLNILNPEALVVRLNVTQSSANHLLDPAYLAGLSDDAVPDLLKLLPHISPGQQGELRRQLCQRNESQGGWAGYNVAQQTVRTARDSCP